MITIQSGKLIIPEEDRFVGFAGDNPGSNVRFTIPGCGSVSGSYSLCLRFDDDSVRVIPLTKSLSGSDLVLTWQVQSDHLLKAGIVMAQVKCTDNGVIRHTSCDYFAVADSADGSADGEADYVSRAEHEEMLTTFLDRIRESAPYVGNDGYWYCYDVGTDSFVRGVKAQPDVDGSMISGSAHPVESRAIQAYVQSAVDAKVSKTTRVAGLPLSDHISSAELAESLSAYVNPRQVVPGQTAGNGGQYGKTSAGEPVMCTLGSTWIRLSTAEETAAKMNKAPSVTFDEVQNLPAGQLFTCQGGIGLKTAVSYIELVKKDIVYTKSEIDAMIGDVETLLAAV